MLICVLLSSDTRYSRNIRSDQLFLFATSRNIRNEYRLLLIQINLRNHCLSKESESNMDNNANVDVEVDPVGGKGGLFPKSEGNSGEDGGEDTGVKWQILAAVVDRIFLIVHVIVLLINIMYFRTIIL